MGKRCANCGSYKKMTKNKGLCLDIGYKKRLINVETGSEVEAFLAVHKNLTCHFWRSIDEYNRNLSRAKTGKII